MSEGIVLSKWHPIVRPSASGWNWGVIKYGTVYGSQRSTTFRFVAVIRARLAARRFNEHPDSWRRL